MDTAKPAEDQVVNPKEAASDARRTIPAEVPPKDIQMSEDDKKPHRIRLLSWNIDGLDNNNRTERTLALCRNIIADDPHIVFLQEVVAETLDIITRKLPMYFVFPGCFFVEPYFTAILLKKGCHKIEQMKIVSLPTQMGRNLMFVKCCVKGERFCFITSHLESMRDFARTRRKQLKRAFSLMDSQPAEYNVIFGGDLNLRDHEVQQIGGLPENVFDIWESTGAREDAKYTWDLVYNDNKKCPQNSRSRPPTSPRFRFDRLYMKYSQPKTVIPVYFELIGFERDKTCRRFCSDHWGLLTHLDILSKLTK